MNAAGIEMMALHGLILGLQAWIIRVQLRHGAKINILIDRQAREGKPIDAEILEDTHGL